MNYEEAIKAAKKRCDGMTADERKMGFASPQDSGILAIVRTAMSAIECGISTDDWDCVAEAQVLLGYASDQLQNVPSADSLRN